MRKILSFFSLYKQCKLVKFVCEKYLIIIISLFNVEAKNKRIKNYYALEILSKRITNYRQKTDSTKSFKTFLLPNFSVVHYFS